MYTIKKRRIGFSILLSALLFLGTMLLSGMAAQVGLARPAATVRYVSSVSGADSGACDDNSAPCRTIQYAIQQADAGDEIRIAALDNAALAVYTATSGSAIITVDKNLTLVGGYLYVHGFGPGIWQRSPLVPAFSQIDGEGARQGLYAVGGGASNIVLDIEWLYFVNGAATRGGNVYAENATIRFSAVGVLSGTATYGGGLYLKNCQTEFDIVNIDLGDIMDLSGAMLIQNNHADYGGGVYVAGGDPALSAIAIYSNTATLEGGGMYLVGGTPIVAGAIVAENTAAQRGGGFFLADSHARIAGTVVYSNTAAQGGGFYLDGPFVSWPVDIPIIVNNYVRYNRGGGFYFKSAIAGLMNNVIADNISTGHGSALYLWASSPQLYHNTIAQNEGASAIYLTHAPGALWPPQAPIPSLPRFSNNIIVSHTLGMQVESTGLPYPLENRATLEGTLWWANVTLSSGDGDIIKQNDVTDEPRFTCAGELPTCLLPYHLAADSAAIDAGVSVLDELPDDDAFLRDIDGQLRPSGAGYDIGADEVVTRTFDVWLLPPLSTLTAAPGEAVTHTHQLLNTGTETDTYALAIDSNQKWATLVGESEITLGTQASTTVEVLVTVPPAATNGMSDTTHLTAISQNDDAREAQAWDATLVFTGTLEIYDVAVGKWADKDNVSGGAPIHYTIHVTRSANITGSLAVTLSDTLVPTSAIAGWDLPAPCNGHLQSGAITCTWTLEPSSLVLALPIVITTSRTHSGVLLNLATVTAPVLDINLRNNTAQALVLVGEIRSVYLPLVLRR